MDENDVGQTPQWTLAWSDEEGSRMARELFVGSFGAEPTGVWSAPGRVNLIGEHVDYNQGLCLPTVLKHRAFVAARQRDDHAIRLVTHADDVAGGGAIWESTLDDVSPESARGWPAYVAGVAWALRERGYWGQGFDIAVASCVPIGAGLSSSAALSCATALAINSMWRLSLDSPSGRVELAEACIDAENAIAARPTGGLDQYTALFCKPDEGVVLDFSFTPPHVEPTPLYFPEYGLALLIIDTQTRHDLSDGQYAVRRAQCEQAARDLGVASLRVIADTPGGISRLDELSDPVIRQRAHHVVTEIERVRHIADELAGTGPAHERFVAVGKAIYRSHVSLDRDFDVSCKELDLAVDTAYTAGALGARMVGGGFGGAAIALVRRVDLDSTSRAIVAAFSKASFASPRFLAI